MHRIHHVRAMVAVAVLAAGAASAPRTLAAQGHDLAPHFEPLRFLLGDCWRGTFANGTTSDVRCYEPVFGGTYIRERHVVRDTAGGPAYRGEALYHWDAKASRIRYTYWNSSGGVSTGEMRVDGSRRLFPAERYAGSDGKTREFRTSWETSADTTWVMITEERRADGGWGVAWRIAFRRDPSARLDERP